MIPAVIRKLDENVVNKIAAGEVIQRPANALKELLENSLDAKSSLIQIIVKNGGLKLLSIQDNGTGIRQDDLKIVCERFTTSKIENFEDLSNVSTFGFRGEALASISHVAHLTIQTRTAQEKCAFKASYADGKLKEPPTPCAGNQGTIITVEDLFYNVPQRKQALKSPNEEFQRISDVISKYAVHNFHVGFTLKKSGENPSIKTNPRSTEIENVRIIYGPQIAKELFNVKFSDEVHKFKINCWLTNINYSAKKGIFLLFINNRLVDSSDLKAALYAVYNAYLPKGCFPFIYIHLELQPARVDVNIHPTKHEVHFLNEDEIIERIKLQVEENLVGSNNARTFYKQTRLPGMSEVKEKSKNDSELQYPKDFVRTDAKEQKLDKFLLSSPTKKKLKAGAHEKEYKSSANLHTKLEISISNGKKETRLSSILNMRSKIESQCSSVQRRMIKESVFVGVVNAKFMLIQSATKLHLCNIKQFSQALFYQRLVYNFENFNEIQIIPPLAVKDLISLALDDPESGWEPDDGSKDDLAEKAVQILTRKSEIMREYFGLRISMDGYLESLPVLLENHKPFLCFLPMYLLRLATEVDWETEEQCFEIFSRETADFYSSLSYAEEGTICQKRVVEHVIYPGLKQFLIPCNDLKTSMFEIADLPSIYKVFERC